MSTSLRHMFIRKTRFQRFDQWIRVPEALAAIGGILLLGADVGLGPDALMSANTMLLVQATLAAILMVRVPVAMLLTSHIREGLQKAPNVSVVFLLSVLGFLAVWLAPDTQAAAVDGLRLSLFGAAVVYGFNTLRAIQRLSVSPLVLFVGSYMVIVLLGAGLLMLPKSHHPDVSVSFVDALFMSASASCVTGLSVFPNVGENFTTLGQVVLMVLIQIGGLGIMTFAAFASIASGAGMSIRDRVAMGEVLNYDVVGKIGRLIFWILGITIVCEGIGAAMMVGHWVDAAGVPLAFGDQVYNSVFHSVSAFCNAGFALYSDNLMHYTGDFPVILTIGGLIVVGGLGFTVIMELVNFKYWHTPFVRRAPLIGKYVRRHPLPRFSLHTKIVLVVTVLLITVGTVGFWLLERTNPNTLEPLGAGSQWVNSLFQGGITPRTAGFNSLDYNAMHESTWYFTILLMAVGASPGSTAGGLKTTSIAILWLSIWNTMRHRPVEVFKRRIQDDQVQRVLVILVMALIVINGAVFALTLTESDIVSGVGAVSGHSWNDPFARLTFETVSAFGTVGLSTGITFDLSDAGKLIITSCMLLGRLGPLTLVLAIGRKQRAQFDYPGENVMLG